MSRYTFTLEIKDIYLHKVYTILNTFRTFEPVSHQLTIFFQSHKVKIAWPKGLLLKCMAIDNHNM